MKNLNCVSAIGNRKLEIGNAPSPRRAFTLVEVMVVVAILSIIAAFVFPAINRAMRYKENAEIANKFQQALLAFELYEAENGEWPVTAAWSQNPPELDGYYFDYYGIDWWTAETKDGGRWYWYFNGSDRAYLYILWENISEEQMVEFDRLVDDGKLNAGVYLASPGWPYLCCRVLY